MFCLFLSTKMHKTTNLSKIRSNLNIRFVNIKIRIKSPESTKYSGLMRLLLASLKSLEHKYDLLISIISSKGTSANDVTHDLKSRGRWFCDYNLCNNKHTESNKNDDFLQCVPWARASYSQVKINLLGVHIWLRHFLVM